MSGSHNGVNLKLREMTRNACFYVHCHAHRVNLVLVDSCQSITKASDLFGLLEAIHTFFIASSLRHNLFVTFQRTNGHYSHGTTKA